MKNDELGKEYTDFDIAEVVPQNEAVVNMWSGKIRSGKTYGATMQVIEDLNAGNVVYATWKIAWEGYDERTSLWNLFLGWLGIKKEFKVFPKENFHHLPFTSEDKRVYLPHGNFLDKFYSLTDCTVYVDEAQGPFNSYEKTNINQAKQNSILFTGHLNRTINIISQRPVQIHAIMRANVARYYFMTKEEGWFGVTFTRKEWQSTDTQNLPDFESEPDEEITYKGDKKIYAVYDSKYMRGDTPASQENLAKIFLVTREDIKKFWRERRKEKEVPLPIPSAEYLHFSQLRAKLKSSEK